MKKTILFLTFCFQLAFAQTPQLAFDINPGQNSSSPSYSVIFGTNMYFSAYTSGFGSELTRFDGTTMPVNVANIYPGPPSSMWEPNPIVFNNKIYFTANNGTNGYELWSYDGSNPPTMVMDINNGTGDSYPNNFIVYNNKLYFSADNGINGIEIWQYDGINPPSMVVDLYVGTSTSSSYTEHFCEFNGKLYFSGKNSSGTAKIWEYNGVSAPTQVFPNHVGAAYINSCNNKMYLRAYNTLNSAVEFLNFDGSNLNIESNVTGAILSSVNNTVYFTKVDPTYGSELWKYNFVSAPVLVADINPGTNSSNPQNVTVYNNKIYFVADDGTHGYEIWVYDGTVASLTGQITPTVIDPQITFLQVFKNKLYFNANPGSSAGLTGSELWVIDNAVSVKEFTKPTDIKLYPNPAKTSITIEYEAPYTDEDKTITISNLLGKKVLELVSKNTLQTIDLEELREGIYFIDIKQNEKTSTAKFIKQ